MDSSDLVLQKLSEMESAVNKMNERIARNTDERDKDTDYPD